jgi:GNAT superfamily N-acetyltransferase
VASVTIYYVEMFARPQQAELAPKDGVSIIHAKRPTVAYYRFLYDAVGNNWNWRSRKKLTDDALATIIHDPRNEVHVVHVDGVPAGFVDVDRRAEGEIEISQFGLIPEFIGQGLGKWFLRWTVDKAWSYGPKRLWLHTCTNDHPMALPNYLKAGFTIYKQEVKEVEA